MDGIEPCKKMRVNRKCKTKICLVFSFRQNYKFFLYLKFYQILRNKFVGRIFGNFSWAEYETNLNLILWDWYWSILLNISCIQQKWFANIIYPELLHFLPFPRWQIIYLGRTSWTKKKNHCESIYNL